VTSAEAAFALPAIGWQRRYAVAVATVDLLIVISCVAIVILAKLGSPNAAANKALVASGLVAGVLMALALALSRAWEERVLGIGAEELRRLYRAFAAAAIGLGLTGLAFKVDSVRPWVFAVIPACGVLCVFGRFGMRKLLHRKRRERRCMLPVLAVGGNEAVTDLIARTQRDPLFGWHVVGACTPRGRGDNGSDKLAGVPVVGDLDAVAAVARSSAYSVVAVAPAPGWGPKRLQALAWDLEGTATELAVDPGLMEIAGPRLHITPIDGLPLLRLVQPRFTGWRRVVKMVFDRSAALLLLLLTTPLLCSLAIAARRDGGPAFFLQERVGMGGRTFRMVKLRSMIVDADRHIDSLVGCNDGAGPLFKMRQDPRVTPFGALLRRYSLDELPQLFNVLTGSMSLVGPRPPLAREVETYGADAQRRLLVRPGITGLWQVSGRSDLSWEESVRLDLRYVENWSIAGDGMIIWKTAGAMLRGRGAY
jgi:exopolysaccharide biosynthesis polyprenyl glycosylphosphotransferase